MNKKIAIIIGAGQAGLTTAYELLKISDFKPIIFEISNDIDGVSKTPVYGGTGLISMGTGFSQSPHGSWIGGRMPYHCRKNLPATTLS